jgi:FtsP/CotA-like multicopper oxidase with cupredoxin domain
MNPRLALLILVLLSLSTLSLASLSQPRKVAATTSYKTFSLVGYVNAWNYTGSPNPPMTVTQGDNVTIHLSSGDSATHLFFIDLDKNGPTPDCSGADICSAAFPPSTKVNFLANFAPGPYTYYCSVHPSYMYGNFIVQGPPPPPPQSDFGVASNPTSISVSQGSSGSSSVTITSVGGFAGTLSLSATVAPSGPQVSISPTMVTLTSGGSATAALTIATSGSGAYSTPTPLGSYTVTITATNSSLSHSATMHLTVGSSSPSGSVSLSVALIVGGVVAAITVVGVAAFLIRRRSK